MSKRETAGGAGERVRLDKWLWAARFFKTRTLAQEAIEGGHVKVQGARAKPSHEVKPGERLTITIGEYVWEITVKALSARIEDALAAAAALLEPKARAVNLPGALLKSEAELDDWLARVRERIAKALGDGPVIPKV